jgi:hypothetical protein
MISATLKHVAPMGRIDIAPLVVVLVPVGSSTTVVEAGVPEDVIVLITTDDGEVDGVSVGADELEMGVDVALD